MLHINKYSSKPIYVQIVEQYCELILSGEISPGDTLPSVRVLSRESGINPNTVQRAYRELETIGLCISTPGSKRIITKDALDILLQRKKMQIDALRNIIKEIKSNGIELEEIMDLVMKYYKEV